MVNEKESLDSILNTVRRVMSFRSRAAVYVGTLSIVALGVVGYGCTKQNGGSSSTIGSPSSVQKIAFASKRNGDYEIYVMNNDGSNQTRLTNNPVMDTDPAWSPR